MMIMVIQCSPTACILIKYTKDDSLHLFFIAFIKSIHSLHFSFPLNLVPTQSKLFSPPTNM